MIWLFDVLVVVALAGVATALLGRSWSWRVPGASFALGVAAQIPFNRAVDPSDIEETLGLAGYVCCSPPS